MSIMPDFVRVCLGAPPWDGAGQVPLLLGDPNFFPFQPQETLGVLNQEAQKASSF